MKNRLVFVFLCIFSISALAKTSEEVSAELIRAQSLYLQDKCAMNSVALWLKIHSAKDVATVAANILGQKGYKYHEFNANIRLTQQNSKLAAVQLSLLDVPEAVIDIDPLQMVGKIVAYNTEDIRKNRYLNFAMVDKNLDVYIIESVLIGQSTWLKNKTGLNSYIYSKDYINRLQGIQNCPVAK